MSIRVWAAVSLLVAVSGMADNQPVLSRQEQLQIVRDYLYVTHQPAPSSLIQAVAPSVDTSVPIKCGMSAVADFVMNRDKFDRNLQIALGIDSLPPRPVLPLSFNSPSGWFKIHYDVAGDNAVYQANVDNNSNGIPDFVDGVARIADSVRAHEVTLLGYPAPPSDSFYIQGDDARYDIYLLNLSPNFYGLAYMDSVRIDGPGTLRATSFIELDNDYQQIPSYASRPLDAVRVTVAHEYFHAVQFGMDYTEAEDYNLSFVKRYWMEMSATWMEEEIYDGINDYYAYLPYFFNQPTVSLQQFKGFTDLHPYGSMVWPLYLAEQFGPDIIRDIWERCAQMGIGPQVWAAANASIDSISSIDTLVTPKSDLPIAFREFALWNYYTGNRASLAPAGVGYPERSAYPAIPDDKMAYHNNYPVSVSVANQFQPQQTAATYIRLDGLNRVAVPWRFLACGRVDPDTLCVIRIVDTICPGFATSIDSQLIPPACRFIDSVCAFRTGCTDTVVVAIDSIFSPAFFVDSLIQPWGVSIIYEPVQNLDSHVVETGLLGAPFGAVFGFEIFNPRQFAAVTFIFSDASYPDAIRYAQDLTRRMAWDVDGQSEPAFGTVPSVLDAYPNPAVVSSMNSQPLRFRFQIPSDSTGLPVCSLDRLYMTVDLFNVAGEYVATIADTANVADRDPRDQYVYLVDWDLKNSSGSNVASGVYVGVARLYCKDWNNGGGELLAEEKTKVAVIR
ncbi:MAG: MXAN_6640 family putative metalloprotease [Candidatus Zixiibacteriota bacterium]